MNGATVSGTVEVDGGYFGGYVKPANYKTNRRDRRRVVNQTGKRRVVVVMRERNGRSLPFVFKSEDASLVTIAQRVVPGSVIHADEAVHWDALHARFLTKRINQKLAFIIMSQGHISPPTQAKWHGARTTFASAMASST